MKRKTRKTRQLALHLERLEDRHLMNGDPAPVEAVVQPILEIPEIVVAPIDWISRPILIGDWFNGGWPGQPIGQPAVATPPIDPLFESVDDIPDWLIEEIDRRYGEQFGTTQTGWRYGWYDADGLGYRLTLAGTTSSSDYSTTNNQVEGVDEADLIETDGEFIYMITGNELVIIDARDSENLSIASRVALTERPTGMYLSGNRLTLISSNQSTWYGGPRIGLGLMVADVAWYGWNNATPTTTITVLDVTDRDAPTQVQKTELDGRMVSSRMVDGELRLVLQQNTTDLSNYLPSLGYEPLYDETTETTSYQYESRDSYLSRVIETMSQSLVPTYRMLDVDGNVVEQQELIARDIVLQPKTGWSYNHTATTIAVFDTLGDTAGPTDTATITTSSAAVVYSTADNLYVFGRDSNNENAWNETAIWKFGFDAEEHSVELVAEGSVEGTLLNQFAVDEHDGYLRIVTETGWGADQTITVLEQVGSELAIVGSLNGLAANERIYSVRFDGDRAFVVTFRIVDPLFAIDLSDPANPEVAGELKVPGYSDYLQFLDDDHLLAIGRGADEVTGLFEELQLSIFQVGDMSDPELLHRYSFEGGRETRTAVTGDQWSLGDGDHHALSYYADQETLAMPVENMDGKSGLQVFRIDVATGIESLALIEHETPVLRSLRLGDKLVAISAGKISVHSFADPATEIEALDIAVGTDSEFTTLASYVNMALRAAEGPQVFDDSSWLAGLSLVNAASQSLFEGDDSLAQDFDYLFAEQSLSQSNAAQPTNSRDRAFDSFFVPVSRSVRAVGEDVAGELAAEFAEAVE